MRCSKAYTAKTTLLFLLTLLPPTTLAAGNLDCERIQVDNQAFDLSKLGGPHAIMHSVELPPSWKNTTYYIDLCAGLERPNSIVDKTGFCPGGTRVCAVEHTINGEQDVVSEVIPIAGELQMFKGGPLDAKIERLRTSTSHADSEKEGLRISMNGGMYSGRKQKSIVELICNKNRTGDEGSLLKEKSESRAVSLIPRAEEDKKDGESEQKDGTDDEFCMSSLRFKSYGPDAGDNDMDVLRMEWQTKYACEDSKGVDAPASSNSWGFFTWFIIIAFMGTAAYLIFGSWLNYNRYGARGWDLLPHGDTIRDLPYLFKDWSRKVFSTIQGGGSRGGYSAV